VIEVSAELQLAPGAHDLDIVGSSGTLLQATDQFEGRGILAGENARRIRLRDFAMDGNRRVLEKPLDTIPGQNAFRSSYRNNGLFLDRIEGLEISNVRISGITNFAILISRSSEVRIERVEVEDSGSRNAHGRNNTTGGILLEEGCANFAVRNCVFHRVRGNALWTHSLGASPRAQDGVFSANRFDSVGRDAVQVGHATRVRVEENTGVRIGFPLEEVDAENQGIPAAIDTAGNVDHSIYARNQFEEVNGKCIDLDGFHDGAVRENRCVNRHGPGEYPFGQFGIVMNNTNPDMRAENIEITGNVIDGAKFGGLFLIGSGHRVTGNRFLNLNTTGCHENAARFGCIYKPDEPAMLESGIYLAAGGSRPAVTRGNVIRDNRISGHQMKARCIGAAPGLSMRANTLSGNICSDDKLAP
jgi:hypothetical protein